MRFSLSVSLVPGVCAPCIRVRTADLASSVERAPCRHTLGNSLVPIGDTTSGEVVRSDLNLHTVTRQDANAVHAHLSGTVRQNHVPVLQFDLEHGVGQRLDNSPFQDNRVFLGLGQVRSPRLQIEIRRRQQGTS